jgi:hypothetical protein
LRDQIAMLAGNDPQTDGLVVMGLHPVGANVDVATVRITTDHRVEGADVPAAVLFMPLRREV